ncbi:MAG: hydrogenase maturation protease [Rhodospirillaceae bacterium]|nr:hydrogenase maturation protease [Rhodospirillaceae bacterium]MCA8931873.1 hydrogenase maturation protease [Rhodospirillaceae bacterium]
MTGPVLQPLVIGVGNRYRTDDGVGPFVADRLAERGVAAREASGEGASLIGLWEGVDAAIVVDAMASRAAPGSIRRFEGATAEIPAGTFAYSSHLFGVAEAVALARELGRLPPRLVLYGIEGESFAAGEALSPPVRAAAEEVVARILTDLAAWQAG